MKLPVSEVDAADLARAVHTAMNTVIQQVGTSFDINALYNQPLQPGASVFEEKVDAVALAAATARIKATAELFDVDAQVLVTLAKEPKAAAHRHKVLARVAVFVGRLPSLLYSEDDETESDSDNGAETCCAESDDDDETDDEIAVGKSGEKAWGRLQAAVNKELDAICKAQEVTELAMQGLEQSLKALIKSKGAKRDD